MFANSDATVCRWPIVSRRSLLRLGALGFGSLALQALLHDKSARAAQRGSIDLHRGLPASSSDLAVRSTTPGIVHRGLLILGSRVAESLPAAPGDVRAFDLESGELVWTFRTIPENGEPGAETWPTDARTTHGGANSWAGMSLDGERGILYVPDFLANAGGLIHLAVALEGGDDAATRRHLQVIPENLAAVITQAKADHAHMDATARRMAEALVSA